MFTLASKQKSWQWRAKLEQKIYNKYNTTEVTSNITLLEFTKKGAIKNDYNRNVIEKEKLKIYTLPNIEGAAGNTKQT